MARKTGDEVSTESKGKALVGVKVVEWAQLVAAPYCAKLLSDFGAEVIKVEKLGLGDAARYRAPFVHDAPHPEQSLLFLYLNSNKLGVTLDIDTPKDRQKFLELVNWADILIEDNLPPVLEELKLTYQDLSKVNPRLVMTSITPFGQTGPYRDYQAYPINSYQSSGLGYLRFVGDGVQVPLKLGAFFSEYTCGLIGAVATLGALYHQRLTGLGQQVDLSKQEAILSLGRVQVDRYPNEKVIQRRLDARRSPGGNFRCRDGYVAVVIMQNHEWQALAKLVADPEMGQDDRYQDEKFREEKREEINQRVAQWMLAHTKEEIYHRGQALGLPVSPVMTAKDIVASAQCHARNFFTEVTHPLAGRLQYPATPYHFSVTPPAIERAAPLLGEHNRQVFSRRQLTPDSPAETVAKEAPLQGIRVADFSWAWAGPHATELLGFLGAEVVKVESLKRIDVVRQRSFSTGQEFSGVDESYVFNELNLNKQSVRLNLSHPKAVELAKALISRSDVVVQNMRPGAMERLGLGYEVVRKLKPDIIYLSSSARGATGPEREYSGYASNFAALGGIAYITGTPEGEPARMAGETDILSGITTALAILAALNYRHKTGQGQHIDLSSSEAASVLIGEVLMDYLVNGRVQAGRGNLDDSMAPHNCYRCKGEDKWVSIAVANDKEWQILSQVMGHPEWAKDERFRTPSARWQNQAELDRLIERWTANYSHYEVMELLQKAGVAAMPCLNAEEVYYNPHLNARQCWTKVVHPLLGEQIVLLPPWKLSLTPPKVVSSAPLFGQHSRSIFKELLGLGEEAIKDLEDEGAIY